MNPFNPFIEPFFATMLTDYLRVAALEFLFEYLVFICKVLLRCTWLPLTQRNKQTTVQLLLVPLPSPFWEPCWYSAYWSYNERVFTFFSYWCGRVQSKNQTWWFGGGACHAFLHRGRRAVSTIVRDLMCSDGVLPAIVLMCIFVAGGPSSHLFEVKWMLND